MSWVSPVPYALISADSEEAAASLKPGEVIVPVSPHKGAFGMGRVRHVHEGIDFYCPPGTVVSTVEEGHIVALTPFTGSQARSDWWRDTDAVLVEGKSGVIVYAEVRPLKELMPGQHVKQGQPIGHINKVVRDGRPDGLLHLELHKHGTRKCEWWKVGGEKPEPLLDPTPYLIKICRNS